MTSDRRPDDGREGFFGTPTEPSEPDEHTEPIVFFPVFGAAASYEERVTSAQERLRRRRRITLSAAAALLAVAGIATIAVAWPGADDDTSTNTAAHTASVSSPHTATGRAPSPSEAARVPAGIPSATTSGIPSRTAPPKSATPTAAATSVPSAGLAPPPGGDTVGLPLSGRTVVIDPGHNPNNGAHTREINRQVEAGGLTKECDTTGTETDDGYTEAEFTLAVSRTVRTFLQAQGAKVVFTWESDTWGPCVDERAARGNEAHADAVVSIHADGGPSGGRGFHVILPGSIEGAKSDPILAPSRSLGALVAKAYGLATGMSPASYLGTADGLVTRTDLGGLNLSTQPKVFIECANMRNSRDAALLTDPTWRDRAASGISVGITAYLLKGT